MHDYGGVIQRFLALLLVLSPAAAGEVVLVLSGEAEPYQLAAEHAAQDLGSGTVLRRLSLESLHKDGLAKVPTEAVMVAIGSPAVVWLDGQLPPVRPLLYTMVAPEHVPTLSARCAGVATEVPAVAQVQSLGIALPRARRLGMLYLSTNARSMQLLAEAKAALPADRELVAVDVHAHAGPGPAITALLAEKVDVVWATADSAVWTKPAIVSLLRDSLRFRVPVAGFSEGFVRSGAALGTGISPVDQGAQVADLVRRHLAGEPLANPPTLARLYLNHTVAAKMGLRFPDEAINQAALVIGAER